MKILIIGQAPSAKEQTVPYDSTMLYDWLIEVGIDKQQAQDMFDFDAVYDKFTGHDKKGGHLKPTNAQMLDYWNRELREKIFNAEKIILLGNVSRDFFRHMTPMDMPTAEVIELIHPSKRNYSIYKATKPEILRKLKQIIL